jgi:uncharacterized membrane protein
VIELSVGILRSGDISWPKAGARQHDTATRCSWRRRRLHRGGTTDAQAETGRGGESGETGCKEGVGETGSKEWQARQKEKGLIRQAFSRASQMQGDRRKFHRLEYQRMDPRPKLPLAAKKNVELVAQVEQQLLGRASPMECVGDGVARFFGSPWFLLAHAAFLAVWIVFNAGAIQSGIPFDPYPFPFLSVVISVEFIFLTTFVLMNQRLQSRRQEHWSHLNLQICMLAEQEITKNMQLLDLVCNRLQVDKPGPDQEMAEFARETPVTALVDEIEKTR